jgi:hypothetical protein
MENTANRAVKEKLLGFLSPIGMNGRVRGIEKMERRQNPLWVGRRLALVLLVAVCGLGLGSTGLPARAAPADPGLTIETPEPPEWWYAPGKPITLSETGEAVEQPGWWYVPRDVQAPSAPDFTTIDVAVTLGGSQDLNAGVIPLDVRVTADGATPEVVIQVTSDEIPHKAIYVDYEKSPDGAVQTLGGFQQARFVGGVGPDNVAQVLFEYEALATGWINFQVQVWVEGNLIYGPETRSLYVSAVPSTFSSLDVTVTPSGNQGLNAGVIPLGVRVTADGTTPEVVVQVTSDEIPHKAIYVDYEKSPGGAVQTLGGFQQARFVGGVGPDHVAQIQFEYEALTVGWFNFQVQVWVGDNLIYGPETYSVYVSAVAPTFTNLAITVTPGGSQGLNAGVIPLGIRITADGTTPELVVQVECEEMPDKFIYVGYEKTPPGAVQTLWGFQQARFAGGVGPDRVAEVRFNYESLTVGWFNFTVQIESEGNLIYGPERHSIYIRDTGVWAATFPPVIKDFSIVSQENRRVTFNVEASGNPDPWYELACGSDGVEATEDFSCPYSEPGRYNVTLKASNLVEGVEYTTASTTAVLVPDDYAFLPLVAYSGSISPSAH